MHAKYVSSIVLVYVSGVIFSAHSGRPMHPTLFVISDFFVLYGVVLPDKSVGVLCSGIIRLLSLISFILFESIFLRAYCRLTLYQMGMCICFRAVLKERSQLSLLVRTISGPRVIIMSALKNFTPTYVPTEGPDSQRSLSESLKVSRAKVSLFLLSLSSSVILF